MNVYLWPTVKVNDKVFTINQSGYRDALCGQIGKLVTDTIDQPKEKLVLRFSDGSEIIISLKERDQTGPEAVYLTLDGKQSSVVW